jgi:hypothetical protein
MTTDLDDRRLSKADISAAMKLYYSKNYKAFVRDAWHILHPNEPFIDNWHIDAICEHLEAQTRGEIQRLIINIPPGSAKSMLVGVYWVPWVWLTNPSLQTVAMAANEALSLRDNQKARLVLDSPWYQSFNPITFPVANSAMKFINEHLGSRQAVPFTSVTGFRADSIIVDDALPAGKASSDAERNFVNEQFWTNVITRLNNPRKSTITIVQQRLHEDDLVGNILNSSQAHRWEKLILPMEKTNYHHVTKIGFSDPRQDGEALFPARWSDEDIDEFKARPYDWASQHQQDPAPTTDGLFSREKLEDAYYDTTSNDPKRQLPKDLNYYLASDHAPGGKAHNDYNVVLLLALDERKDIYVIDSFRKQCELNEALGITIDKDGKLKVASKGALAFAKSHRIMRWFAEADVAFKGQVGTLKDMMRATGVHAPLEMVSPHGRSKTDKTLALQGYVNLGRVHFRKGSGIFTDAVNEFAKFPVGKNDDIVDALAIFCRAIDEAHGAIAAPKSIVRPERDGYRSRSVTTDQRQRGFY